MFNLWRDLRDGLRGLRKAPGFAAIGIATLALGMAVNTTIFSVVNGMLLRPLPVPHANEIQVLALRQAGNPAYTFSYPDYQDLRNESKAFRSLFAYQITLVGLAVDGQGDHCVIGRVTGNYFSALEITPGAGRLILPTEGQTPGADSVLVLGYAYWQKRFGGSSDVIGKQAEVNGHAFRIVGVTPKGFNGTYSVLNMDGYVPWSAPTEDEGDRSVQTTWTDRSDRSLTVMGRLQPGATLREAQVSTNVIAGRLAEEHPEVDKGISIRVYPEKLARPEPDADNTVLTVSIAFMVLAALVLLVACFNIANVLLVRATVRQREMALRAALGASRGTLLREQLTESLLLSLLGAGAGLLLASWATGFLTSIPLGTDLPITFDFHPDGRVYVFALAVALVTTMISGIVPALRAARADVGAFLREGERGSSAGLRRRFVRNTFVVAQVAGSLLLLVVAGLFVRSLGKAEHLNLGFNPDHVLDASVDVDQIGYKEAKGREFYRDLERRLSAEPGVVSVAEAFSTPMGYISSNEPVTIQGRPVAPGQQPPTVSFDFVTPGYFRTLQIVLLRGRDFQETDTEKAPMVAVVNETMANKFWPNQDPIGKTFLIPDAKGKPIQVVGVVATGKYLSVMEPPQPYFYLPIEQEYVSLRSVLIRTSVPPDNFKLRAETEIRTLAPNLPVTQIRTMNQSLQGANGFLFFRLAAQLTAVMGLLGLTLAVVGVYGVVSYTAAQRTHEIGIRLAIGAEPRHILRLMLGQGLGVIAIGIVFGLMAALAATGAMSGMLLAVNPRDPLIYTLVSLFLCCVALLACFMPARRAMRTDPLVALRYE